MVRVMPSLSLVNRTAEALPDRTPKKVIFTHKVKTGNVFECVDVFNIMKIKLGLYATNAQLKLLFAHMPVMNYAEMGWTLQPYQ